MSAAIAQIQPFIDPVDATSSHATGFVSVPHTGALQQIYRQNMGMGLALAEASGNLTDAAAQLDQQTDDLHLVVSATEELARSSKMIGSRLETMGGKVGSVGAGLGGCITELGGCVDQTTALFGDLVRDANAMDSTLSSAAAKVENLRKSSSSIQNVAREIQLLAVNAGVEAARHGVAGRGFAVIAEAVKKLADQTRLATEKTEQHLIQLAETMTEVLERGQANLSTARASETISTTMIGSVERLRSAASEMGTMVRDVEALGDPVRQNVALCSSVLERVASSSRMLDSCNSNVQSATERFQRLVGISESISTCVLSTAVPLPISGLADLCRATADSIGQIFAGAIASGALSRQQLFDDQYRPIPGSNPQQYLTGFTGFTDRELATLQDVTAGKDRRITFCAAVDRNGYLPTHNRQFSQPQGSDPAWNAANCRNRRIFDDRTGLASARNTRPLLLQTYRRDMGNGDHIVMNELSAPIMVEGRHWGGFRMGFRHD